MMRLPLFETMELLRELEIDIGCDSDERHASSKQLKPPGFVVSNTGVST